MTAEIKDLSKQEIIDLIEKVKAAFQKAMLRVGNNGISIYFFNTKNSVNCLLNISTELAANYKLDLEKILNNKNETQNKDTDN